MPTLLIVDDEPNIIAGLRRALRAEPYQILSANSAHDALSIVKDRTVDIVVTDEQMPGMSGTELLRKLRQNHPETMAIMLTGNPSLEVALKAINDGEIYRFFTKPCKDDELIQAVKEALKHRDQLSKSRRLVDVMKAEERILKDLERESPGITKVNRSESGAIIVNSNNSLKSLMDELSGHSGGEEE